MTTPFNFLGTQALAKVFKGNNSNQTWKVKKGHKVLDLFSHPGQGAGLAQTFLSLELCQEEARLCIKNRLTEDFSSGSIPSGLLCGQDSYIRVWKPRLLAVSWTLLHNTESLSHCLQVLRASA